jgi:hypothetical protein
MGASDHHVWWVVAQDRQIYAGTLTGERRKYTGAYLLVSANEGATWQKLLEDSDGGAALGAFQAESRELSAEGWLYCATMSGKSYRIRRVPQTSVYSRWLRLQKRLAGAGIYFASLPTSPFTLIAHYLLYSFYDFGRLGHHFFC